jgi:hypothetical protein
MELLCRSKSNLARTDQDNTCTCLKYAALTSELDMDYPTDMRMNNDNNNDNIFYVNEDQGQTVLQVL